MIRPVLVSLIATLSIAGCASMPTKDPLQVTVTSIEPLQEKEEGLEIRLLVRLRVQNPNADAISYDGAYVKLEVQDRTFATGVSNVDGSVPGFSEAVVEVPVTISMLRMVRHVIGMQDGPPAEQIRYSMSGKLGMHRFGTSGEFSLKPQPAAAPAEAT